MNSEKDLSAIKDQKKKKNRIQSKNGNKRRSSRIEQTSEKRQKGADTAVNTDIITAQLGREHGAKNKPLLQIGRAKFSALPRVRRKNEFEYIKRFGKKISGATVILLHCPSQDGILKLGIVCGRKFDKRAVRRNRAKRLLREAFRLVMNGIVESQILLIPKKGILESSFRKVQEDLSELLTKAGLWK